MRHRRPGMVKGVQVRIGDSAIRTLLLTGKGDGWTLPGARLIAQLENNIPRRIHVWQVDYTGVATMRRGGGWYQWRVF